MSKPPNISEQVSTQSLYLFHKNNLLCECLIRSWFSRGSPNNVFNIAFTLNSEFSLHWMGLAPVSGKWVRGSILDQEPGWFYSHSTEQKEKPRRKTLQTLQVMQKDQKYDINYGGSGACRQGLCSSCRVIDNHSTTQVEFKEFQGILQLLKRQFHTELGTKILPFIL